MDSRESKKLEMDDLFLSAAEVAEEAIVNSLSQAITTTGRMGNIIHAYPFE
ncbi:MULTISPECIES: P1 family peptidase [Sporosarcina]|uniref:P1 family peptidase n=1 Tax=Sporosarcina TaxID=1569 RepID=UPI0012F48FAC|nr:MULTISPECIES: P1 family peptidase [Sporosarcina]